MGLSRTLITNARHYNSQIPLRENEDIMSHTLGECSIVGL